MNSWTIYLEGEHNYDECLRNATKNILLMIAKLWLRPVILNLGYKQQLSSKAMRKDFISGFSSFASFDIVRVPKFDFWSKKSRGSVIAGADDINFLTTPLQVPRLYG